MAEVTQRAAPERSFCTTREAAELLGVSVATVQVWVEDGVLDAWKTAGGHRRVLRNSIERLLHRPARGRGAADRAMPHRRSSILVVDDDVDLLRNYAARLSRWPGSPVVACVDNAVRALLRIGRSAPDLLVVNLDTPGMDGFTLLHTLRHHGDLAAMAIVAITHLDADAIRGRGGVPADVIPFRKPVPFDALLAVWNRIAAAAAANRVVGEGTA